MSTQGFLVFTLYANIGAFGGVAPGRRRTGERRPRRSATLGLIGAALGIDATDEPAHAQLEADLHHAVRTESAAQPFIDFHTTHTPKGKSRQHATTRREELLAGNLHTVVSEREWHTGAMFTIVVWERAGRGCDLEGIAAALRKPKNALYVGRRAGALGLPPRPEVITEQTFLHALDARSLSSTERWVMHQCDGNNESEREIACDANAPGAPEHAQIETTCDVIENRAMWQFGEREMRIFNEEGTQ